MYRLFYNIYSNISDRQFLAAGKRMTIWESKMGTILLGVGWIMTMPVIENDALIIDFVKHGKEFNGNIGITVEDIPGKLVFTFYVTKSFEEDGYSYFLREYIFQEQKITFFEKDIGKITDDTLQKYNSWTKDHVKEFGEKRDCKLNCVS